MPSDRALIATRKGLFTITRGAGGWAVSGVAFTGDNVPMVLPDRRDGALYAVLGHGHFGTKLHRRDAGGEWTEIAAPEYPPQPEGEIDIEPFRQIPIPWATALLWTLEAAHPDAPGLHASLPEGFGDGGLSERDVHVFAEALLPLAREGLAGDAPAIEELAARRRHGDRRGEDGCAIAVVRAEKRHGGVAHVALVAPAGEARAEIGKGHQGRPTGIETGPESARARSNMASNIAWVRRPVNVFCWLG